MQADFELVGPIEAFRSIIAAFPEVVKTSNIVFFKAANDGVKVTRTFCLERGFQSIFIPKSVFPGTSFPHFTIHFLDKILQKLSMVADAADETLSMLVRRNMENTGSFCFLAKNNKTGINTFTSWEDCVFGTCAPSCDVKPDFCIGGETFGLKLRSIIRDNCETNTKIVLSASQDQMIMECNPLLRATRIPALCVGASKEFDNVTCYLPIGYATWFRLPSKRGYAELYSLTLTSPENEIVLVAQDYISSLDQCLTVTFAIKRVESCKF